MKHLLVAAIATVSLSAQSFEYLDTKRDSHTVAVGIGHSTQKGNYELGNEYGSFEEDYDTKVTTAGVMVTQGIARLGVYVANVDSGLNNDEEQTVAVSGELLIEGGSSDVAISAGREFGEDDNATNLGVALGGNGIAEVYFDTTQYDDSNAGDAYSVGARFMREIKPSVYLYGSGSFGVFTQSKFDDGEKLTSHRLSSITAGLGSDISESLEVRAGVTIVREKAVYDFGRYDADFERKSTGLSVTVVGKF